MGLSPLFNPPAVGYVRHPPDGELSMIDIERLARAKGWHTDQHGHASCPIAVEINSWRMRVWFSGQRWPAELGPITAALWMMVVLSGRTTDQGRAVLRSASDRAVLVSGLGRQSSV